MNVINTWNSLISIWPNVLNLYSIAIRMRNKFFGSSYEGRGRLLLRSSGTEPVIRVMVEGDEGLGIQQLADEVADAIERAA